MTTLPEKIVGVRLYFEECCSVDKKAAFLSLEESLLFFDLLLCVGERLFSISLKAIESIFKVGIVGLRGLSLYFKVCMTIAETLTLL